MSSIKEQVLAQQGQYSESDDKYLSVLKMCIRDSLWIESTERLPWIPIRRSISF